MPVGTYGIQMGDNEAHLVPPRRRAARARMAEAKKEVSAGFAQMRSQLRRELRAKAKRKAKRSPPKTSTLMIWKIPAKVKCDFKKVCAAHNVTMRLAIINYIIGVSSNPSHYGWKKPK